MNLEDLKTYLKSRESISFKLPDGTLVPAHFHVTEIGKITKHYIDCGGTERLEHKASLQLYNADDYDHRIHPEKLTAIIELSQNKLGLSQEEIEVEYQGDSIMKFALVIHDDVLQLESTQTDCLAKDKCGIEEKKDFSLNIAGGGACTPGGGCC